ncbi:unnamed protein product [Blepharisma stoltei]|uniref:Mediator complex subunit 9 n=1 Tax=Blepharisma stoltei TaxID=1481888 RepID=A0AAU9JMX4_9CILI|nr:unnamed protein product [Blepharisma stoltei]
MDEYEMERKISDAFLTLKNTVKKALNDIKGDEDLQQFEKTSQKLASEINSIKNLIKEVNDSVPEKDILTQKLEILRKRKQEQENLIRSLTMVTNGEASSPMDLDRGI